MYSFGWSNRKPKRLHEKGEAYLNPRPGIDHGKFVRPSEYSATGEKRVVLIDLTGALDLAQEFNLLASKWKRETGLRSSLSEKFMHPAYQRIMAMGKPALRFILRDLERNSGHWFYALRFIVDNDVAAGTQTVGQARAAWLEWGYSNGYI